MEKRDKTVTEKMCALGYNNNEESIEELTNEKESKNYALIETVLGGQPYCGGRYGNSQYLKNVHWKKKIKAVVETIFDNGTPENSNHTVYPRRRKHIGCTQWQGDGVPPQYFLRRIISVEFVS